MLNRVWNSIKLSVGLATTTALLVGCNTGGDRERKEPQSPSEAGVSVARGKYLVKVSGCNDCHSAGYLLADGSLDEKQWLTGDNTGWRGPWGTTYPSNLRLFMKDLSEDQWVDAARHLRRRPPMPWFNLNSMAEADLRSIYRFTRSLGDPGRPAPVGLAPGEESKGPYGNCADQVIELSVELVEVVANDGEERPARPRIAPEDSHHDPSLAFAERRAEWRASRPANAPAPAVPC